MTILGKVIGGPSPASVNIQGTELMLDADGDTTITADTDDTIDIKIAGADDFQFSANSFNVLSGSTLTIDSGATITNSGTANNFGTDPESAYAGVLQTNANFVDQVIFGPSVDGRAWNGLWNKASLFSSLMLATIEDEGSNTEINIWDLTEQTSGTISTTPLGTVDLSSAATPTAIAACMGYLIVSSEDGIAIIDPHSGSWAERTVGWPRTLSSSAGPALTNNDVQNVDAGLSDQPAYDARTGGPLPTFACSYGTGADLGSIIKDDGNVFDVAGTIDNPAICLIQNGKVTFGQSSGDRIVVSQPPISAIAADDWSLGDYGSSSATQSLPGLGITNAMGGQGNLTVGASASGLTSFLGVVPTSPHVNVANAAENSASALITRTYNTGYMMPAPRGAWLANSKTADYSSRSNTLTENGTVTEGAVESGCELLGYSGWSTSNYLSRANDSDYNSIGTGSVYSSIWFKSSGTSGDECLTAISNADGSLEFRLSLSTAGNIDAVDDGATANIVTSSAVGALDTGVWHKVDFVRVSSTERYLYIDGVLNKSETANAGSLSGTILKRIGIFADNSTQPASTSTMALDRLSTTAPSATQIRQMYEAEKGMFVASAECLLQSGSTDAVLDLNVDPLTNKVIVTQTDAITIFDGLVVDSKPTVNSGNSEKGKLWGALRTEQNSANAYVTAPAVDQRQVNEMVRGMASDLPAGVDLGKAKAWIKGNTDGTIASSYNIKANTSGSTGICYLDFGIPFKSADYISIGGTKDNSSAIDFSISTWAQTTSRISMARTEDSADADGEFYMLFFGELENE